MTQQKQTQTLNTILQTLNRIEVRGSENISLMYNLMGYISQEIKQIEELEKSPPLDKEG